METTEGEHGVAMLILWCIGGEVSDGRLGNLLTTALFDSSLQLVCDSCCRFCSTFGSGVGRRGHGAWGDKRHACGSHLVSGEPQLTNCFVLNVHFLAGVAQPVQQAFGTTPVVQAFHHLLILVGVSILQCVQGAFNVAQLHRGVEGLGHRLDWVVVEPGICHGLVDHWATGLHIVQAQVDTVEHLEDATACPLVEQVLHHLGITHTDHQIRCHLHPGRARLVEGHGCTIRTKHAGGNVPSAG